MEIAALENPARVAREMAQTRLDGVYSRMDDDDCTRPFRNQMVIRIASGSVLYSRLRSVDIELPIRFDDGCSDSFELDWTRANPSCSDSTQELSGRCICHEQIDKHSAQAVLFAEATVSF